MEAPMKQNADTGLVIQLDTGAPTDLKSKIEDVLAKAADPSVSHADYRTWSVMLLRFHNSATGQLNPSMFEIAKACARHPRRTLESLQGFRNQGYLDFDSGNGGRNKRNTYKLRLKKPCRHGMVSGVNPAVSDVETLPPRHTQRTLESNTVIRGTFGASSRSKKRGQAGKTPRAILESVLDADHAAAVLEHRQRLRAPLTSRAATLLANQFGACPDPNAAADTMVARGWRGFEAGWLSRGEVEKNGGGCTIRKGSEEFEAWMRHANKSNDYGLQGRLRYAGDEVEVPSRWPGR
jgi:hypothetical protein